MERVKLKEKAKELLRGKYTPLVIGVLVFVVAGMFGSILDSIFNVKYLSYLFSIAAEVLFMMGFVNSIMKTARKENVEVENIFHHVGLGLKYLVLTLIISLIIGLLTLLLAIAGTSLSIVFMNIRNIDLFLFVTLVVVGIFLMFAIFAFAIYLIISFSQVYFILNDEPEEKISEILNKSFDMLDGYRLEYFVLCLSFIGWMILGLFTFGILYLWLIPYMMVTFALFYEEVKERYSYSAPLKDEKIEDSLEEKAEKPKKAETKEEDSLEEKPKKPKKTETEEEPKKEEK